MLLAGGKESSQLEKWSEHSVSVQAHPTAETATLPSNHLGFNSSLIDLMEGSIANTSPRTHRGAELALAPPPSPMAGATVLAHIYLDEKAEKTWLAFWVKVLDFLLSRGLEGRQMEIKVTAAPNTFHCAETSLTRSVCVS